MRFPKDFMKVKPSSLKPAAGRILISVPFFNDLFFNRAVVLLTDYSEESAAGLILNRMTDATVNEIVPSIRVKEKVHFGGPVMSDLLFGIHNHHSSKEPPLLENLYVGYDEILLALIENATIPQLKYKFFVGYAGWAPGQLEEEMENGMWIVGQESADFIFNTPYGEIWNAAVRNLGEEYQHWLSFPHHIEDN